MKEDMKLSTFIEAKEKYNEFREAERNKIINYLIENGHKVSKRGGKGKPHYSNHGRLQREYNLTNWKWISFIVGDNEIFISLQAFDRDSVTNNYHVLMDRIGVCSYPKSQKNPDYLKLMHVTSLELPLDSKGLTDLYEILKKLM